MVTALGGLSFSLFELSDQRSLEFGFFSAVSSAVVFQIRFKLVRWVFGWSILLRIPEIEKVKVVALRKEGNALPLDSEPGHSRLLSKNISADSFNYRLGGRVLRELFRVVFIVHVVSNTDKFSAVIAACEKDHSDTENFRSRDSLQVRSIGLEKELVDANGDGSDKKRVEFLVIFRTTQVSTANLHLYAGSFDLRCSRADVSEFPFQVWQLGC